MRSSRWPSCKPVPWRSLQTIHQISITRFTVLVVYTPVSVAKRCSSDSVVLIGHMPRTNLASPRPCLISLRTVTLGDRANRNRAASANLIAPMQLNLGAVLVLSQP